ncbi:DUF1772 domain-containing protein [Pseudorhodoplanes sinuspersici]|uniref:Uncharacterized protein n=1 Tax=Pseudorhodoplanes sinuspersici TaxID=1235591 RepID=A0A1W6ZL42_9HYPH|nr:DUF1772 domain-containing protein [Pseudorhodoplanes sinuspersici]ARP98128.1 hypothetical protein CAK95_02810 [Pseudorhodoplanes sinuspersici]RKE68119.1 uncharacterized protein DUF1772 [Pseudorhodoplanes sinuspersici]
MLQRLATFTCAAAFAAIAIYISIVEQPSRLLMDDRSQLLQWASSYPPAMKIQGGLAILAGLSAIWIWFRSRNALWLIGALLILANWPYTLLMLNPINHALMTMASSASVETSRALVEQWGWLHAVRSLLGVIAAGLFAVALVRDVKTQPGAAIAAT